MAWASMALRHLWKASLVTSLLLACMPFASADSGNAEDGARSQENGEQEPCTVVWIDTEDPYVDPHPECIPEFINCSFSCLVRSS